MINLRSKLRQKLLGYYFTNPQAEHYLRELAELLRVDPANLSRELRKLVGQGFFVGHTRGRQKYFRLNRTHPLYNEVRRIVFKTVGVVGELQSTLAHVPGIQDAYLYGSFARDQQDPQSDIDLLVIGEVDAETLETAIRRLERRLGREINYTLMTRKEFRLRRSRKDPFLEDVWRNKRIKLLAA
ncbi:nucleotidyltransferase domain-containing protein [Acidobacteria bacterium AH-259-L09]|nr:nucleotidyltransferase domain-containing protein [Acidobacteria bacterium AH-259-L09]